MTTRVIVTLVFDVRPEEDAELTCLLCNRNLIPCDRTATLYRNGETAVVGLHQECVFVHTRRRENAIARAEKLTPAQSERQPS